MKVAEIFESMEYGPAPEAAGPVHEWLDSHGRIFGHFIGGTFAPGREHFDSVDPATGKPLAKIAQASPEEVGAAVEAARRAFPAWSGLPGHERARHLVIPPRRAAAASSPRQRSPRSPR